MDKREVKISFSQKGMDRKSRDGFFMLNGDIDNEGRRYYFAFNEPSNILLSKLKKGFKVLAHKVDFLNNCVYLFMVNTDTNVSEIGKINNLTNFSEENDIINECHCEFSSVLSQPLENTIQQEIVNYETIIEDSCNGCLGFTTYNHLSVVMKQEKRGTTLYWTDNNKEQRYLELFRLNEYKEQGMISCGNGQTIPTCIDCKKLPIFNKYKIPRIKPVSILDNGNLGNGIYEAVVAYSDKVGNTISDFYSQTNSVSIYDRGARLKGETTNRGIKFEVELDDSYKFYKVVIIKRGIDQAVRYIDLGVKPIDNKIIYFYSELDGVAATLESITQKHPKYKTTEDLEIINGYLFHKGLTAYKELNLQPVVNLMGSLVKWGTVMANADLYEDGVNSSKFKTYHREETVPFGINFGLKGGRETAIFPFIARPPIDFELNGEFLNEKSLVDVSDDNVSTILNSKDCDISDRNKYWQFYNTAVELGDLPHDVINFDTFTRTSVKSCSIYDFYTLSDNVIRITEDLFEYTDLISYIENNKNDITDPNSEYYNQEIADVLNDPLPNITCDVTLPATCVDNGLNKKEILVSDVINDEIVDKKQKQLSDYRKSGTKRAFPGTKFDFYNSKSDDPDKIITRDGFAQDCLGLSLLPNGVTYPPVYDRKLPDNHGWHDNAFSITIGGRRPIYSGILCRDNLDDVLTSYPSGAVAESIGFYNRLSRYSIFFLYNEYSNTEDDYIIIELTKYNPLIMTYGADYGFMTNPHGVIRVTLLQKDDPYELLEAIDDNGVLKSSVITQTAIGRLLKVKKSLIDRGFYINIDFVIEHTNTGKYFIKPPGGNIDLIIRRQEYEYYDVHYDYIKFDKNYYHNVTCTYIKPKKLCDVIPHKYGLFSYVESKETYPDNSELYDSSNLVINESDITNNEDLTLFKKFYSKGVNGGIIELKDADFRCKPIRHYKFPSNAVSPFLSDFYLYKSEKPYIYPIGVMINNETVKDFLKIALNNNLITQEEFDDIESYTLYRGDMSEKSVISKGLLFDMWKYKDGETDVLFPNYPYNDLRKNSLIKYNNSYLINYTNGLRNNFFSYHSPDVHFLKKTSGNEIILDNAQYGYSEGVFDYVKEHSKWVILSRKAFETADNLATAESLLEWAIKIGNISSGNWLTGLIVAGVVTATSYALTGGLGILGKGKYSLDWQKTFENLGTPKNFAKYYTSIGVYNNFSDGVLSNSIRRKIKKSVFLKSGLYSIGELNINNRDREWSLFLELEKKIRYSNIFINSDDSRFNISSKLSCNSNEKVFANISSLYATLYNYTPNQHGDIDSVNWVSISNNIDIDAKQSDVNLMFGGNIYISPMSVKRKFPLFTSTAVGLSPMTKFQYSKYHNILENRYWIDYGLTNKKKTINSFIYPRIDSDYNLDCELEKDFYLDNQSSFYLYYYGNPIFYVESEINLHNRNVGNGLRESFYPDVGDYVEWTQEVNVSIKEPNYYNIDSVYSNNKLALPYTTLPRTYSKRTWDTLYDKPNGVMYSMQDNSENDIYDPYLIYKALDIKDFPTEYGKLIGINGIESEQLLLRFERESILFNAIDNIADRLAPETQNLGSGNMFNRTRPLEFSKTDLGYSGTQNRAFVSSKYGHFWTDAKNGSVFWLKTGAKGFVDIARYNADGLPSGMEEWFKRHLPYKATKWIDNLDIDNPENGVGITLGWDNKRDRLFLTKKDFILTEYIKLCYCNGKYYEKLDEKETISIEENKGNKFIKKDCCGFIFEKTENTDDFYEIELPLDVDGVDNDPKYCKCGELFYGYASKQSIIDSETANGSEYLGEDCCKLQFRKNKEKVIEYTIKGDEVDIEPLKKDVSFTMSWSAKRGSWVSYYDFKPNYYISFRDYFATGLNTDDNTFGIWGHLLTNRSYLVYYGQPYEWAVELPVTNEFKDRVLNSITYELEARRYFNYYDYANKVDIGFDYLTIYNQSSNSGYLKLVNQKHNFVNLGEYPKTIDSLTQEVLQSQEDNETYNINYFFNRIVNPYSGVPVWLNDENEIKKELNPQAVSFYGKSLLDRIYGNDFKLLFRSKDTQHRLILKWEFSDVSDKL